MQTSAKKLREKSENVLEQKRKTGQAKNLHKKDTFTIIAMNFAREQLKNKLRHQPAQ